MPDSTAFPASGRQAVILCGGLGTRLGKLTTDTPKPMLPLRGKPLLQHSIEKLRDEGFDDFLLAAGYKAEVIRDHFEKLDLGVRIRVFEESLPLGTAGPLRLLEAELADDFLVLYGDVFIDFHVAELWQAHRAHRPSATLLVRPSDHPWDSDLVKVDGAGRIIGFLKAREPRSRPRNLANAAVYAVSRSVLPWVEPGQSADFVRDLFPKVLAARGELRSHLFSGEGFLKDMGTPERLEKVERYLEERDWIEAARASGPGPLKTVFLDRDGVLNEDSDLIDRPERLKLLPGAAEAVAQLNRAGLEVIVVTNQPVIARGLCTLETLEAIHLRLQQLLAESGAHLDALYFCPHHPETHHGEGVENLRVACACRKPQAGMIFRAVRERAVDLASSLLIGDRDVDAEAARRAGIRFLAVG
ncbi:MAG: HAD-IIIA family hydrolase, partial [Verrucomicrobiota bacterium]